MINSIQNPIPTAPHRFIPFLVQTSGLSIAELSRKLDVPQPSLWRWSLPVGHEKRTSPSVETWVAFLEKVGKAGYPTSMGNGKRRK